jgi:hypothetical protein
MMRIIAPTWPSVWEKRPAITVFANAEVQKMRSETFRNFSLKLFSWILTCPPFPA